MAAARVLLLLSGHPEAASFARSVRGLLGAGPGPEPWPTHCSFKRGQLVLSGGPFPDASARLPLQRPSFCPFAALDQPSEVPGTELPTDRGVDLGVAVILQSTEQTVLLTRRTRTLSISPNLWVPPGGHVEPDEELLDGGLRELREETGLQLAEGQFSWVPLGLWEESQQQLQVGLAVKEGNGAQGSPGNQVLPVIKARIQPNPSEVNAFVWLRPDVAAAVAASEDGTETTRTLPQDLPPSVLAVELKENGATQSLALPMSTLLRTATAEDKERVSTGTKFALKLWLQHLGK